MQPISEEIMKRFQVKKPASGVNSAFSEAVDQVKNAITDQPWTFKRWCGYLRGIEPNKILDMLKDARKSDNPGRKFNWLVREHRRVDN